jgi:hypothetical protein
MDNFFIFHLGSINKVTSYPRQFGFDFQLNKRVSALPTPLDPIQTPYPMGTSDFFPLN